MWHVTRNIIVKEFVPNLFSTMRWEPVTMVIPNIEYIYKCFYFAYPRKPFELCLKALVEVPIHNN